MLLVACTGRGGDNAITPENPLANAGGAKAADVVGTGGTGGGPLGGEPLGNGPELPLGGG